MVEVDGGWSVWSVWSSCSVSCANGSRSRDRTCDDPAPEHGGLDCIGSGNESETCQELPCPGKSLVHNLTNFKPKQSCMSQVVVKWLRFHQLVMWHYV